MTVALAVLAGTTVLVARWGSPMPVIAGAEKVETYRIAGGSRTSEARFAGPGEPSVFGYAILARGHDLDPGSGARLAEALGHSDKTTPPKCYWPGVAFRFHKGGRVVDLAVCFHCNDYCIGDRSNEWGPIYGMTKPVRTVLAQMAKEAFPDDAANQAAATDAGAGKE